MNKYQLFLLELEKLCLKHDVSIVIDEYGIRLIDFNQKEMDNLINNTIQGDKL